VFDPLPSEDGPRNAEAFLTPYSDLSRGWRSSWKALANRNPVVAAWLHHLGRTAPCKAVAVEMARHLTRNAVKASWRMRSTLHLV
jgi:hypothetical protein